MRLLQMPMMQMISRFDTCFHIADERAAIRTIRPLPLGEFTVRHGDAWPAGSPPHIAAHI